MKIQEYLEKLIKHLGVEEEFEILLEESEDKLKITINVSQDDVALLIGNRGETLEAMELLTKLSFKDEYTDKKIMLDINDYRANLENKVKDKAMELARRAIETGREQEMYNLNSYERYLVHTALSESEDKDLKDIESFSEDSDDGRVLVIRVKKD